MPIVLVHGVNNHREDADYDGGVERMRGAQNLPAPKIGINPGQLTKFFSWWGGNGVKFRWAQASLPNSADLVETLSLKVPSPASEWLAEPRRQYRPRTVNRGSDHP